MLHNTINIDLPYQEFGIEQQGNATITTYIKDVFPNDQDPFRRPLIVICPGGGYNHHSPREGEAIAIKMLDMGYNAVVLRYSLAPVTYPAQLFEAAYTMKYVRDNAAEWDVDPDKIIIAGFSAGGHVAGLLGTGWNSKRLDYLLENVLHCSHEYVKPDGMLLGYPVITSSRPMVWSPLMICSLLPTSIPRINSSSQMSRVMIWWIFFKSRFRKR